MKRINVLIAFMLALVISLSVLTACQTAVNTDEAESQTTQSASTDGKSGETDATEPAKTAGASATALPAATEDGGSEGEAQKPLTGFATAEECALAYFNWWITGDFDKIYDAYPQDYAKRYISGKGYTVDGFKAMCMAAAKRLEGYEVVDIDLTDVEEIELDDTDIKNAKRMYGVDVRESMKYGADVNYNDDIGSPVSRYFYTFVIRTDDGWFLSPGVFESFYEVVEVYSGN